MCASRVPVDYKLKKKRFKKSLACVRDFHRTPYTKSTVAAAAAAAAITAGRTPLIPRESSFRENDAIRYFFFVCSVISIIVPSCLLSSTRMFRYSYHTTTVDNAATATVRTVLRLTDCNPT